MLYEYYCEECDKVFSRCSSIEKRNDQLCECGHKATKLVSYNARPVVDSRLKDSKGSPIWFPSVGGYFDRAANRRFETKKEKHAWMKETGTIQDGSADNKSSRKRPEAGTTRDITPVYSIPK